MPSFYFSYRFTQIAVDPQVKVPGGKSYDVLFIGTGKEQCLMKIDIEFIIFNDAFLISFRQWENYQSC